MRKAILSVISVVILVLIPIALVGFTQRAAADPLVSCDTAQSGNTLTISCEAAGVNVLHTSVKLPVDVKTVTIRIPVPGPVRTITEPGSIKTIIEPGSTATVTRTVTIHDHSTVTIAPHAHVSHEVKTLTVEPSRDSSPHLSRQPHVVPATIGPSELPQPVIHLPAITINGPTAVGIGIFTIAIFVGLIVLGLWFGYYMGYKDSDKAEAKFLRALLRRDK
jgi:hypothetical protein